jgi:hypothetical protein
MALAFTNPKVIGYPDVTQNQEIVEMIMTLSGNYGGAATHGDTANFSGLNFLKSRAIPTRVDIWEMPPAGTAPSFYEGVYCPGTTQANGVISFALAGVEYTEAAAYAGVIAAATFRVFAYFPLGK